MIKQPDNFKDKGEQNMNDRQDLQLQDEAHMEWAEPREYTYRDWAIDEVVYFVSFIEGPGSTSVTGIRFSKGTVEAVAKDYMLVKAPIGVMRSLTYHDAFKTVSQLRDAVIVRAKQLYEEAMNQERMDKYDLPKDPR